MDRVYSIIEGFIAGIIFGSASIFIRLLTLSGVDIYTIVFGRLGIAALISIPITILLYLNRLKTVVRGRSLIQHALLGWLLGLHFILFTAGVRDTSIANATILVNTVPIQSLVILYIVGYREISIHDYITVLIAFIGSALIAAPNVGTSRLYGDIEAFLAATALAIYLIIGRRLRISINPMISMPLIYLFASLTVFPILIYGGKVENSIMSLNDLSIIIYLICLGILPTWVGHTLYYSSLSGLKPYETAILGLLEPIGASILAYIIFREVPHPYLYIGGTLIAASILILSLKSKT